MKNNLTIHLMGVVVISTLIKGVTSTIANSNIFVNCVNHLLMAIMYALIVKENEDVS